MGHYFWDWRRTSAVAGGLRALRQQACAVLFAALLMMSGRQAGALDLEPYASIGGACTGLAAQNFYVYMVQGDALQVLDLLASPGQVEKGRVALPYQVRSFTRTGSMGYAALTDGSLQIIDLSNINAPALRGRWMPPAGSSVRRCVVSLGNAYVCTSGANGSLRVLDVSDPDAPTQRSNLSVAGGPRYVAYVSGQVYVACESPNALHVINAANPAAPFL